jgi:hypothetical protein
MLTVSAPTVNDVRVLKLSRLGMIVSAVNLRLICV